MIPVDRSQSTSGFIEFLATNANWPETIPGLGNSAHINRNASNHRQITIPSWRCIVGRHICGGNQSAIQLFHLSFSQTIYNQLLLPGDIIILFRIESTNNI